MEPPAGLPVSEQVTIFNSPLLQQAFAVAESAWINWRVYIAQGLSDGTGLSDDRDLDEDFETYKFLIRRRLQILHDEDASLDPTRIHLSDASTVADSSLSINPVDMPINLEYDFDLESASCMNGSNANCLPPSHTPSLIPQQPYHNQLTQRSGTTNEDTVRVDSRTLTHPSQGLTETYPNVDTNILTRALQIDPHVHGDCGYYDTSAVVAARTSECPYTPLISFPQEVAGQIRQSASAISSSNRSRRVPTTSVRLQRSMSPERMSIDQRGENVGASCSAAHFRDHDEPLWHPDRIKAYLMASSKTLCMRIELYELIRDIANADCLICLRKMARTTQGLDQNNSLDQISEIFARINMTDFGMTYLGLRQCFDTKELYKLLWSDADSPFHGCAPHARQIAASKAPRKGNPRKLRIAEATDEIVGRLAPGTRPGSLDFKRIRPQVIFLRKVGSRLTTFAEKFGSFSICLAFFASNREQNRTCWKSHIMFRISDEAFKCLVTALQATQGPELQRLSTSLGGLGGFNKGLEILASMDEQSFASAPKFSEAVFEQINAYDDATP